MRLPALLTQIKAGNNSYKPKIEIRRIVYLLYQLTKTLQQFNQVIILGIFMNTENSKRNESHKFVVKKLSQRLDLRSFNKHVAPQNLCLLHLEKYKTTVQKQ